MFVLGGGHWMVGVIVIICAYATSFFITGRLFVIVKPNLLKLPWFAAMWSWFVAVRDKALRWLRTVLGSTPDDTLLAVLDSLLVQSDNHPPTKRNYSRHVERSSWFSLAMRSCGSVALFIRYWKSPSARGNSCVIVLALFEAPPPKCGM
jgi:hypothetical protein